MKEETTHHIFPQDERDTYNVDIKENKISMHRKRHDALHVLFDNNLPKEQLSQLLALNTSVIAPDVLQALHDILALSEEDFYIPEVLIRKQ
jgi:hypothetical protein